MSLKDVPSLDPTSDRNVFAEVYLSTIVLSNAVLIDVPIPLALVTASLKAEVIVPSSQAVFILPATPET